MAENAVLFLEPAPTLIVSVGSTGEDGTGENPWDTFLRHHPTTPTVIEPTHPEVGETASEDPNQAEEEDLAEDDNDDDDDDESPDEHARACADAN